MAANAPVDAYGQREPTGNERLINIAISILLILIGIGSFAALILSIVNNENLERAIEGPDYEGLGADVRLVEPEATILNQPHFSLNVERSGLAAQAGIESDDVLVSVAGTEVDSLSQTVEDIQVLLATVLQTAVESGDPDIPVTVFRGGETLSFSIPVPEDLPDDLFEIDPPLALNTEEIIGLGLEAQDAVELLGSYYALDPEDGGPTSEITSGARIVSIDGVEIDPATMDLEDVRRLVRDQDVDPDDEDFQIALEYEEFEGNRSEISERTFAKEVVPTIFIGFADELGFVIPLLELFLGFVFLRLGYQLFSWDISAARWAQVAFLWLSVGLVVLFLLQLWIEGKGGDVRSKEPADLVMGFGETWFYLVPLIFFVPALWWLGKHEGFLYRGEEGLSQRNTRFAWTLLIPTLAVLIVVAARPLEQTFIKSLTDDVFADNRPAQFVGLSNYQNLLTFRPVIVDCRITGRYLVTDVADGSAAAQAGVMNGDVIMSVAGEDIEDVVDERSDLEVRIDEEGMSDGDRIEDLTSNEQITEPFEEGFTALVSEAVDGGEEEIEIEVARFDDERERWDDQELVVPVAGLSGNSPGDFGIDTRFEGGCTRAAGGKRAIQWTRTDLEGQTGDDRYTQAVAYSLPFSDTKGLKIVAKDPEFINSFLNTIRFTVTSVFFELIIGLTIAMVVNSKFAGRGLMRAAMLVPWAIPTVVAATLWQSMLRPDNTGIVNKFLMDLGFFDRPQQWLTDLGPWMNSIVAVDVWKTSPFMALLILAGLQTIPSDMYEAASVDGASKVRQFLSITLPLLRPTIAVALIFRTLDSLRVFDVFQVLLDPTRPSMATYNYTTMVDGQREVGYASAIGVLIFIFILIFTVIYVRFVGIENE